MRGKGATPVAPRLHTFQNPYPPGYTRDMYTASLLREARLEAGLTQAELASRSGTSQATLCAYERGQKSPSTATLERILAATGRRLATERTSRTVRSPGAAMLAQAGRSLEQVIELAAELPTSHRRTPMFPGLPRHPATEP